MSIRNFLFMTGFSLFFLFCDEESQQIIITDYNNELSISENLNNGVSIEEIIENTSVAALYGLEYGGGYIFYVDQNDFSLLVATDFSEMGNVPWGDVFSLDTSAEIGSGRENTDLIIQGNLNDNSINGTEHGNDNYAFKIVDDLVYNNHNDWFIPSSGSMSVIYDNVHSNGFGNFDEDLVYWSSTKQGYFPYVMSFDLSLGWGGQSFLGACTQVNGLLIARKVSH